MGRRNYFSPRSVENHRLVHAKMALALAGVSNAPAEDIVEGLAAYEKLIKRHDELLAALFKYTDLQHQLVDAHGDLFHTEAIGTIAALEEIFRKGSLP